MAELVSGRLVTDGTGKLYVMPVDDPDNTAIHVADKMGVPTDQLIDSLTEVAWDEDAGGYVEVLEGEDSHNARHHLQDLDISGTSGPLFDADGVMVYPGDPHHEGPLLDDPNVDDEGRVVVDTIPDEISSTATSHTEAYTS